MSDGDGTAGDSSGTVMDRRALLRAGGVVAGIAGIGGYAAAQAPAAAAAGDPVLMGATNDAYEPALSLANTGSGAPLRLQEDSNPSDNANGPGDLRNNRGELQFSHFVGGEFLFAPVFTSYNASQLFPVRPFRAVDTRTTVGRANIVNGGVGNLDSAGRLIGGHTIEIGLGNEVFQGTAVFANLTVTGAVSSGYLTVWPSGARPGTSSLNYSAGQVVANFCVSGLSSVDSVRLYAKTTTHVLLDVVAFAAGSPSKVGPMLAAAGPSSLAGPARKPPAWFTGKNG
ncbi:MAG: hypothetical protein QOE53_1851 [Pseudonocardiales bacterium]|jgi:hypothetical protein|nr:hypothetical protein [Pseudonocardiales bacterium]